MSDVIDLEREQNVKKHGPLGALLETAAERGPDEIETMAKVCELLQPFDDRARRRMYHWIEARIDYDRKAQKTQKGKPE